jgi:Leucine-rich repeat (LRR) protein
LLSPRQIKITDLAGVRASGADLADSGPKLPPMEIVLRGEDAIVSYAGKLRDGKMTGKLDLGELGLRAVPPAVMELSTLTNLRLDNNRLTSIPDHVSQLHQLKSMSLNGCSRLTALPIKMGRLTNLTRLSVGAVCHIVR